MDIKTIAKTISLIEDNSNQKKTILSKLYAKTGSAHRIGITGPPGAGKSSLINILIQKLRSKNKKVAIICIDPTSPFSGGAILGDRIRMLKHYSDPGVYIRSMASRNASGGLSLASSEASDVLDANGFDVIIFETLGVGQVEIDVMNEADTVAVVLVPESGDDIQMMKSGLIEIADIYVVNKSDRSGANRLTTTLTNMLETNPNPIENSWDIPILNTNALSNTGIDSFLDSINEHFRYMKTEGVLVTKTNDRYERQVKSTILARLSNYLWNDNKKTDLLTKELNKDISNRLSPIELVDLILKEEQY